MRSRVEQHRAAQHRDVATTPQEKPSKTRKVRKVSEAEAEGTVKVNERKREKVGVFGNLCPFKSSCCCLYSLLKWTFSA